MPPQVRRKCARPRERIECTLEDAPRAAPELRCRRRHEGVRSLVPPVYGLALMAGSRSHVSRVKRMACRPGYGVDSATVPGTVLVVDDEPSIRLLCRINLELEGYRVMEAGSLAEARTAAASPDLSLVLLDLRLGHESGRTLLEELRSRTPRVPVALVTGSVELDRGDGPADATLVKPFTIEALLRTVRELTSR